MLFVVNAVAEVYPVAQAREPRGECAGCLLRVARACAARCGLRGEDVEDCAMDFVVRIWHPASCRLPTGVGCARCAGLLRISAYRHSLDTIRRLRRTRSHEMRAGLDPTIVMKRSAAWTEPGADELVLKLELIRHISIAARMLAPGDRLLIERRYFAGETVATIAESLGIPVGTAQQRLRRARLRLRHKLNQAGW